MITLWYLAYPQTSRWFGQRQEKRCFSGEKRPPNPLSLQGNTKKGFFLRKFWKKKRNQRLIFFFKKMGSVLRFPTRALLISVILTPPQCAMQFNSSHDEPGRIQHLKGAQPMRHPDQHMCVHSSALSFVYCSFSVYSEKFELWSLGFKNPNPYMLFWRSFVAWEWWGDAKMTHRTVWGPARSWASRQRFKFTRHWRCCTIGT